MNGPVDVPSLDSLIAEPMKAATLPPEVARTMLAGLAGLLPVLIAQTSQGTNKTETPTPERLLTVEEVLNQFGVKKRWLYRHKKQMPHSQPSRKLLLFPEERLRKWFASRKTG